MSTALRLATVCCFISKLTWLILLSTSYGRGQPSTFTRPSFLIQPHSPVTVSELNTTVRLFWRISSGDSCQGCVRVSLDTQLGLLLYSWPGDNSLPAASAADYEYNATTSLAENPAQNGSWFVDVTLFVFVDEILLESIGYVYCEVTAAIGQARHQLRSEPVYLEMAVSPTPTTDLLPTESSSTTAHPQTSTNDTYTQPFFISQNTTASSSINVLSTFIVYHYLTLLICFGQVLCFQTIL